MSISVRHIGPARLAVLLLTLAALGSTVSGQGAQRADQRPDPFAGLTFRNIGPASMGGRIDDLAVLETNPAVFYVGAATGGLWKTMNNGTTWEVLFDDLDDVVSIGDIAITPDDANTVWVGSGENNNRQSGSWGNGVYKSIDGGKTWKHMGLRDSGHIARIGAGPREQQDAVCRDLPAPSRDVRHERRRSREPSTRAAMPAGPGRS